MKTKRTPLPTEQQTRILRRIAQSGGIMMLTHNKDGTDSYTDSAGAPVVWETARAFIRNGWVTPQQDSMFETAPQTWLVKRP